MPYVHFWLCGSYVDLLPSMEQLQLVGKDGEYSDRPVFSSSSSDDADEEDVYLEPRDFQPELSGITGEKYLLYRVTRQQSARPPLLQ